MEVDSASGWECDVDCAKPCELEAGSAIAKDTVARWV